MSSLSNAKIHTLQWLENNTLGMKVLSSYRRQKRSYKLNQLTLQQKQKYSSFLHVESLVSAWERQHPLKGAPVLFLNASSRTTTLSYHEAATLFASWVLRVSGRRVIHLSCQGGMSQCLQGASWADTAIEPPCFECTSLSRAVLPQQHTKALQQWPLQYDPDILEWSASLSSMSIAELEYVTFDGLDLGQIVLPSLLWSMRLASAARDSNSKALFIRYLTSAAQTARSFLKLIQTEKPAAVVVFNGVTSPESVVAILAQNAGIPLVTYETGYREGSIFFCHGRKATHYEIVVPEDFHFGVSEAKELDEYLTRRFKGNFTMGGIRFWPEMNTIDKKLLAKISTHRQTVTVFTNVVFDTSQAHGNTCFRNMFQWLETTMQLAKQNPETLFIVRAHPDEARPGKASRQPVSQWLKENHWDQLTNVHIIEPTERISSYELIHQSKFVMVYNSLIGLEALLLGKLTVTGACTRYHTSNAALFFQSPAAYGVEVQKLLSATEIINDPERQHRARRFYYFTMFKGFLNLKPYLGEENNCAATITSAQQLLPQNSQEAEILLDGILKSQPFHYPYPSKQ